MTFLYQFVTCWFSAKNKPITGLALFIGALCCLGGISYAQPRLSPVPNDPQFKQDVERSRDIIKALLYENRQQYEKALEIWYSVDHRNPKKVQDHIFYLELIDLSSERYPDVPETDASRYLMARYLSWVKKWRKAIETLTVHEDPGLNSVKTNLEIIRLGLYLGDYDQVASSLFSLEGTNRREQFELSILKVWYNILRENDKEALSLLGTIDDQYLYVSPSITRPFGEQFITYNPLNQVISELLRYPKDIGLYEEVVRRLLLEKQWKRLSQLHKTHQLMANRNWWWSVLAEMHLNMEQQEQLNTLVRTTLQSIPVSPEYFDIRARMAIKNMRWEQLHEIARQYLKYYPELYDGRLYLAEYYRRTGNVDELNSIMSGLSDIVRTKYEYQ